MKGKVRVEERRSRFKIEEGKGAYLSSSPLGFLGGERILVPIETEGL